MYRKVFCFGAFSLLIIIACVSLACGSKDPAKEIIGKWVVVKSDVHVGGKPEKDAFVGGGIEFLSDKTFIATKQGRDVFSPQGTWTILDDGRIKIIEGGEPEFTTIQGNQMIIERHNKTGPYTRYKLFLEKKTAK